MLGPKSEAKVKAEIGSSMNGARRGPHKIEEVQK